MNVGKFKMIILDAPNKCASTKKKYLRANHSRFLNKEFRKTLYKLFRNQFLKEKSFDAKGAAYFSVNSVMDNKNLLCKVR